MANTFDPTINGTDLFNAIEPVLDEHYLDYRTFISELSLEISNYISDFYLAAGVYTGVSEHGPSSLTAAIGILTPLSITFADPVPYNYIQWFKNTLATKLTWELSTQLPHTVTPIQLVPLASILETLDDLSVISTSKGFWALICDMIVWSILSSVTMDTPIPATATDGTAGSITWIPFNMPSFTHNFIAVVHYDGKNQNVKHWLALNNIPVGNTPQTVEVIYDNLAYQNAITKWLSLKNLTKDCEFYKLQDDDRRILLTSGYNL